MLPLRYKLSLYLIIFSAIVLAFLWVFQTAFLEVCYEEIKINQIKNCASQISQSIKDDEDTTLTINTISKENEMSVFVYNSSDTIIVQEYASDYNNPSGRDEMEMHHVYEYYRLATENGGSYITVLSPDEKADKSTTLKKPSATPDEAPSVKNDNNQGNGNMPEDLTKKSSVKNMVYAEVMDLSDGTQCFLLVTAMVTPVTAVMNTLRLQLIIVSVVFIIVALIVALIISRKISKPIVNISTSVKELSRRNYDVEFKGSGYREVKELSDTLNRTRQELKKVDVLQQELIANISHDLRTPLTMITGYGEVMRDLPDENTPENIQVIIDEANRLTSLVNDMLDLSKLKSGTMEIEKEIYSLTESVEQIFLRYGKLREQEGYDIQFKADKNVFVYADEIKIGQVVYNFINNAINHCGEDKKVIVTQKISSGKVRIEVEDHGEGITPDKLEYIWDRYYKVDKDHKRGVIGTGLGLSIVKNILDLHDARYGVRSKVGSGSVFWFELEYESCEPLN